MLVAVAAAAVVVGDGGGGTGRQTSNEKRLSQSSTLQPKLSTFNPEAYAISDRPHAPGAGTLPPLCGRCF